MMPRRNLELKVRVPDLAGVGAACRRVATPAAVMEQVDTYFHAAHGRLKLRESAGASSACEATLIAYDRPDRTDVRASDYHLVAVSDAAGVKSALSAALGVRGVVRKRREVHMYHNVRIHLDDVEGLGTFVELEAVISPEVDEHVSLTRLEALCGLLGLSRDDGIAGSYADLLGL
jgi:predicted adenylyl cyclase CyaB